MVDTAELSLALFTPQIGTAFDVVDGAHREVLTLTEARPLKDWSGMGRPAGCFDLAFEGSSQSAVMAQGIKRFCHASLGSFEMAIVPRARLPQGTIRYTATFS